MLGCLGRSRYEAKATRSLGPGGVCAGVVAASPRLAASGTTRDLMLGRMAPDCGRAASLGSVRQSSSATGAASPIKGRMRGSRLVLMPSKRYSVAANSGTVEQGPPLPEALGTDVHRQRELRKLDLLAGRVGH